MNNGRSGSSEREKALVVFLEILGFLKESSFELKLYFNSNNKI
ncbi:hypothetical protein [Bacillus thuringiensis]|nr:hypothetical protein [Bacillus thuringiensis]